MFEASHFFVPRVLLPYFSQHSLWGFILSLFLSVHNLALSRTHSSQTLCSPLVLLHEEVAQLQEEVHLLRQMKDMLSKDLEETQGGCSANLLSATELRVQLSDKEQELERAKEALQGQEAAEASSLHICAATRAALKTQQIQLPRLLAERLTV